MHITFIIQIGDVKNQLVVFVSFVKGNLASVCVNQQSDNQTSRMIGVASVEVSNLEDDHCL